MTDEEVYARLRAGATEMMDELVERYYGPLRGYFMRMMHGNLSDAEDLAQEAFIRVLRYQGAPPGNFRAWVYTIARNLVYDRYRSAAYRYERVGQKNDLLDEADEFDSSANTASADEPTEERLVLQAAGVKVKERLAQLPENQRELIILRFYQGLKLEEIATVTGNPLGTVKSRLFFGLKRMKEMLKDDLLEEAAYGAK